MQDSNPLNLFTRQVLWPVELIRQVFNVRTPSGNRTRDRHVISVPHQPSVLPAWSERLVDELRHAGGEAELRICPGADHSGVLDVAGAEIVAQLVG